MLLQPVNPVAASLHEWICYRQTDSWTNLLEVSSFMSDVAVGTGSTTTLCMLSAPDWAYNGYEEVVELAASFPVLVLKWISDLEQGIKVADKVLAEYNLENPSKNPGSSAANVARHRISLCNDLANIRENETYLKPSEILRPERERAFLENLYQLPVMTDARKALDGRIERADLTIQRLSALESLLHEERVRRHQTVIQVILFVVSFFSFASLLTLAVELVYGTTLSPFASKDSELEHETGGWLTDQDPERVFWIVVGIYFAFFIVGLLAVMRYSGWKFWRRK
jgi:hypothetical protein